MKNEDELKQKFLDLIEISEKIKKNEVADYLEIPERELLFHLVKWKDLGFKIENEYLIQTKIIQYTLEGQKDEEKEEKSNESNQETVFSSSQD